MSLQEVTLNVQSCMPSITNISNLFPDLSTSKRKAPSLPVPPEPKRQRQSHRPFPWSCKQPAPGSLNASLQERKRERLYVRPIAWTEAQLQLLGVTFEKTTTQNRTKAATAENAQKHHCDDKKEEDERRHIEQASRTNDHWKKQEWLKAVKSLKSAVLVHRYVITDLLEILGLEYYCEREPNIHPHQSSTLLFRFEDRAADRICTEGLYQKGRAPPCVAYINFATISTLRKRYILDKNPTPRRANRPVVERGKKMLRSITPSDACEDPYIVSILVALAQERLGGLSCRQSEETQTLHVIALRPGKLFFYTASVSADFLQKLQKPSEYTKATELKVKYCSVSLVDSQKAASRLWRVLKQSLPG